jgi:hypothetical protein
MGLSSYNYDFQLQLNFWEIYKNEKDFHWSLFYDAISLRTYC